MQDQDLQQALTILLKIFQDQATLTHEIRHSTCSALSKEICFGVCRQYFRLGAIADHLLTKRPKKITVWLILLIGLYQLHFLNNKAYAVVNKTVDLLTGKKFEWAKGIINAVLRKFIRTREDLLQTLQNNHFFLYNHPDWLINQIKQDWPNDWLELLKNNDAHPPMSLRINQRKISREDYLKKLSINKIEAFPHQDSPVGIILEKPCPVDELPGFKLGEISVQDEAAQLVIPLLELAPNQRLLDACCAPGGKLCHILEHTNLKQCIGVDQDSKRLKLVKDNLARLNLEATLINADLLKPKTWWDGVLFDRILLDAPCSATGVIRRHPDIKILRKDSDLLKIISLQRSLLENLWPLLAPNGLLVYVTCSILLAENELQITEFIKNRPDCVIKKETISWGRFTGHGWQILTGEYNRDGFFYSVLQKKLPLSS